MSGIKFERVHERAIAERCCRRRRRDGQTEGCRHATLAELGSERSQRLIAGQNSRGEANAQLVEKLDFGQGYDVGGDVVEADGARSLCGDTRKDGAIGHATGRCRRCPLIDLRHRHCKVVRQTRCL